MACVPQGFQVSRVQTLLQPGPHHRLPARLGASPQRGYLGTRLVPRLQARQGRLLEGNLESRQLEKRR